MTLAAALVGLALSAAGAGETEVTFDGAGGLPGLVTDLLKQLAHRLAAGGIVSLRFDKRAAPAYRHHCPADPEARRRFFAWPSFTGDVLAAYRHLLGQPEHDTQVSPARDAERLATARSRRPLTETRLVVVPRASHSFKAVSGPDDPGFAGPVVPRVLDELVAWIEHQPSGSRR